PDQGVEGRQHVANFVRPVLLDAGAEREVGAGSRQPDRFERRRAAVGGDGALQGAHHGDVEDISGGSVKGQTQPRPAVQPFMSYKKLAHQHALVTQEIPCMVPVRSQGDQIPRSLPQETMVPEAGQPRASTEVAPNSSGKNRRRWKRELMSGSARMGHRVTAAAWPRAEAAHKYSMSDTISIEGLVELFAGDLSLGIPLSVGGDSLAPLAGRIG